MTQVELISPRHIPSPAFLYQVKVPAQAKELRIILYSFLLATFKAKRMQRAAISTLLTYICHSFLKTFHTYLFIQYLLSPSFMLGSFLGDLEYSSE